DEKNPPLKWSKTGDKTENILWRKKLPGPAGATPAVWGDRIFLTSVDDDRLVLLCYDKDGNQLWRREVAVGNKNVRGDEGNSASPSPITDGSHVWTFMANGILACYDFAGNEIWKFDIQDRYGKLNIQFGMTSTPLLHDGRLYMQLIHGDGNPATREARVVCLNAANGKEIWQQQRPSDARDECEHSYASPTLYSDDKQTYLLVHGADFITAHRLDNGEEIWRCGNLNPKEGYNPTFRLIASPTAAPGLIVVPTAKGGKVVGIKPDGIGLKPDGAGDITDSKEHILWTLPRNTPDVPSPLIHDGLVYLCRENGNLMVLDAVTGRKIYEERTTADRHRASPVFADGKLYLTARNGVITVVKAGRKFEILARNDIGEPISANPSVQNRPQAVE
ncbi:MAG: PQQ-binding-like beta-propeller repeat protein, partial [Planctomycetes bacterium]|nr:PQQ-binding-like beta-propeller repeat protein [Planctomycetota bacterium]